MTGGTEANQAEICESGLEGSRPPGGGGGGGGAWAGCCPDGLLTGGMLGL